MDTFTTERAREQVDRILQYVAFPGLAFIVDADAHLVAAVGGVQGVDAETLARAFGARPDAVVRPAAGVLDERLTVGLVPAGHSMQSLGVREMYLLCAVTPDAVSGSLVRDRLQRAARLLGRMLRDSPAGSGRSGALALLGLDVNWRGKSKDAS